MSKTVSCLVYFARFLSFLIATLFSLSLALVAKCQANFNVYFNMCIETCIETEEFNSICVVCAARCTSTDMLFACDVFEHLTYYVLGALCTFCFPEWHWFQYYSTSRAFRFIFFSLSYFFFCFVSCCVSIFFCCHCHRCATLLDNNLTSSPTISIKNHSPLRNNFEQSILQKMKLIRFIRSHSPPEWYNSKPVVQAFASYQIHSLNIFRLHLHFCYSFAFNCAAHFHHFSTSPVFGRFIFILSQSNANNNYVAKHEIFLYFLCNNQCTCTCNYWMKVLNNSSTQQQ